MAQTMVRIRANIRDEIVQNLMNRKFVNDNLEVDKLREDLEAKARKMRELAYKACFTEAQIKKMKDLPKGWLPLATDGKIRIEDPKNPENYTEEQASWRTNGDEYGGYDEDDEDAGKNGARPVPFKNTYHGGGYYMNVITTDHPYVKAKEAHAEAYRNLCAKESALREGKRAAERKVLTIIESVTTIKRLLEIWPEVHEFLPEMVSGEAGAVPAELISEINKEFGIGTTEEK
jgi:hypothetical protein